MINVTQCYQEPLHMARLYDAFYVNIPLWVSKAASGSITFSLIPVSCSNSGSDIFLEAFFEIEQVSKTFPIFNNLSVSKVKISKKL